MGYKVIARYGAMGFLGTFDASMEGLRRGDKVVLRTERGSEAGEIVCVHGADSGCGACATGASQVEPGRTEARQTETNPPEATPPETPPAQDAPVETSAPPVHAPDASVPGGNGKTDGEVLRALEPHEEQELRRIREETAPKEMTFCRERVKALNLPMKLVDSEHLLGGEKIIFYFVADGRVDFRQLVKDIAREYKTRIELRQIGVRDEARLLSDLGHCGQCLCCKSFMKSLEPVTMRMAKSQKATLDPTKISGVCGRLMCCLRYEDKIYSELKARLPKRGSTIRTKKASGKVIDIDVLAQIVSIRTAESNILRVPVSDILPSDGRQAPDDDDTDTPQDDTPKQERPETRRSDGGGKPAAPRPSDRQGRPDGRRGRGGRRRRSGNK